MKQVTDKIELFESMPIRRAAMTLIVPTVISQLVMLVYNMADTWFIGRTGDPYQVAAVTVTYPLFMLLYVISNLFGIGGGSLISRMLGSREQERTGNLASFILWSSGAAVVALGVILLSFDGKILLLLGTDAKSLPYAQQYLFWTIVVGGLPTVWNLVLAGIIRAEGEARIASIGMSLGGILNLVMDPIFIFALKMGVSGAALSTCVSNTISLLFLIGYSVMHRADCLVKISLFPRQLRSIRTREVYLIGTPAALQILLAAISNAVLVWLMSGYAVAAISGMGVMQKVESIPFQAIMGISDGILPLIAYNYASGNRERMQQAVRFALLCGAVCACACFGLFEIAAPMLVQFFIADAQSVMFGAAFVRLRILALPFITVEFMLIAVFQSVGGARQAFLLSVFRKGILDLPLMIAANILLPMYGLMLVQPFMECMGCFLALWLYRRLQQRMKSRT